MHRTGEREKKINSPSGRTAGGVNFEFKHGLLGSDYFFHNLSTLVGKEKKLNLTQVDYLGDSTRLIIFRKQTDQYTESECQGLDLRQWNRATDDLASSFNIISRMSWDRFAGGCV